MSRRPDPLAAALERLRAQAQGPLVLACSGGLDSTVLLHALAADADLRAGGLRAVHVHHGWSDQAEVWASQVSQRAAQLQVPLTVLRVKPDFAGGSGPEAAARKARYRALAGDLKINELLVTAQHADDQAETLLLNLLRGSGLDGLAGMRERVRIHGCRIWRPLLKVPRSSLRAYAGEHGLQWIDDPSNADPRLGRGFLRQQVLPRLLQRWPDAGTRLAQCAGLLRSDAELLAQQVAMALAACRDLDPAILQISSLLKLDSRLRARVLRSWLRQIGLPAPPARLLEQLLTQLPRLPADATPDWRWRNCRIRRYRGVLHAATATPPLRLHLRWDGHELDLPDGLGRVHWSGPPQAWLLHHREGGEKLQWHGHQRPLKHVLQELGVPPWTRERMVLLSSIEGDQRRLRAVLGLVLDDSLYQLMQQGARLVHQPTPENSGPRLT